MKTTKWIVWVMEDAKWLAAHCETVEAFALPFKAMPTPIVCRNTGFYGAEMPEVMQLPLQAEQRDRERGALAFLKVIEGQRERIAGLERELMLAKQGRVSVSRLCALLDLATTVRESLQAKARRTKDNRLAKFEDKLLAMAIKAEASK